MTVAGASGSFELNVAMPVIARTCWSRCDCCHVDPCWPNAASMASPRDAERCGATPVVPVGGHPLDQYVGYKTPAKSQAGLANGTTIRETVIDSATSSAASSSTSELDKALDIDSMTGR